MSEQKAGAAICVGEVGDRIGARRRRPRSRSSCGGDAFNTAVYLARAGIDTAFASAVGDDPYSDSVVALAAAEGVSADLILRVAGRLPALCLIENGAAGERSFRYWREPRRRASYSSSRTGCGWPKALPRRGSFTSPASRCRSIRTMVSAAFFAVLEVARQQGAKVAFDGNFRPRGWKGDLARTRTVFIEALKRVDIALPAFDDEAVLWGDPSPEATVARLQAFGIGEIVVKNGPNSALVAAGGAQEFVPVPEVVVPVDATAAGDGFNAGYLAARLCGKAPVEAAGAAHRLAGDVIRHPGALMPRTAAAMH